MRAHTVWYRRVRKGGDQKACTERLLCGAGCAGEAGGLSSGTLPCGTVSSTGCVVTALTETLFCARRRGAVQELAIAEYALFLLFCFPLAPN